MRPPSCSPVGSSIVSGWVSIQHDSRGPARDVDNLLSGAPGTRAAAGAGEVDASATGMGAVGAAGARTVAAAIAGTGAAVGFELVRLTTAPPGDVALLSCTVAISSSPLNGAGRVRLRPVTLGGAVLTVKLAAVEKAVTAAVVGELSPWAERMRQNLVPGVSESTVKVGPLS